MTNLSRRSFLAGASALAGLGGCRSLWLPSDDPRLKVGVISDIHVTTPASTAMFERALLYFRDRKADAVLIAGDLSDWGLLSGLRCVADAWNRVFPNDKAPDGRKVTKLFVTGNHDYEGWWYGDMTAEMHALGYSEDEAMIKLGMKKCWEETFQEPFAPVRRRTVNGYDFVSGEWYGGRDKTPGFNLMPDWFKEHGKELDPSRPFFYFQHPPVPSTVVSSSKAGGPFQQITDTLAAYPNAVAFTGHTHWTFNDERAIWQGAFTGVSIPSLSYTTVPGGYENGSDIRNGRKPPTRAMPIIPARFNLEEAQGYFMSVYADRIVFDRHDFTQNVAGGAPWVVPLPMREDSKPFTFKAHGARTPVPEFPKGAKLRTFTTNSDARSGHWQIVFVLDFPAATAVPGARAFDYEMRAVPKDGSEPVVKRFLAPAFHKLSKDEPANLRFWMDSMDMPQDVEYRIEVYPRNCFGACGKPLVDGVLRRAKPGKDKVRS